MIGRHKFASGVSDGADDTLILPSDWNEDVIIGKELTNRTAGTLTVGDVVAIDPDNNASVELEDTQGTERPLLVLVSAVPSSASHTPGTTVANLANGLFASAGIMTVKVASATTRGNYLRKSSTTKALEDTGIAQTVEEPAGAVAVALTSSVGAGTVTAMFGGFPTVVRVSAGHLFGLTLANNGDDATNDIDIATGEAASDGSTPQLMKLTTALTKRLDATWAVGDDAGMLASGEAIADTTYHIFLIKRPDTGVVDIAADDDADGANIAANTNVAYTLKRRIGSIVRASSAIRAFTQRGDLFRWVIKPAADFDTTSGTTANTVTCAVPLGIEVQVMGTWRTSASARILWTALDEEDAAPAATTIPGGQGAASAQNDTFGPLYTNTSGQVRLRSDSNVTITAGTHGWIDRRGKDS